tara:strand:- start:7823 stop:7999 length:177 start_codon:yes stop_codon:yes gene_type:complete
MTKIKNVDVSMLTKRQQIAMKAHSKHHTTSHIKSMVEMMKNGMTFTASHKAAMKKVGK